MAAAIFKYPLADILRFACRLGGPTSEAFPDLVGDPGSDAASLMSEKLLLRPSALEECPFAFLWLNLIPRRGLAILKAFCTRSGDPFPFR